MLNQEFNKKKIDNNIIVIHPKINLLNYLKFFKIFFYNLFCNSFGLKNKIIDQDLILSDYINDFIYSTKSLSNLKNLIMPYEGQAFQKNIFYKQKKLKKKKLKLMVLTILLLIQLQLNYIIPPVHQINY